MKALAVAGLALALTGAACKDEGKPAESSNTESPPAQKQPDETQKQPDETQKQPDETQITDAAAEAIAKPEHCTDPCRLLASESLADAIARVNTECGESLDAGDDCERFDYLRNCIYAANGYQFKKQKWQQAFADKDWYEPDPKFRDSKISKIGMTNVAELKRRAADCEVGAKGLTGKVFGEGSVDFGDGNALTVRVGKKAIDVGGTVIAHEHKFEGWEKARIETVDIDKSDAHKEALIRIAEYEDLAYHIIVTNVGGKPRASKQIYTADLELQGGGKLVATDSNCGVTHTEVLSLSKGVVKRKSKKTTGKRDESMCAACPFVYILGEDEWQLRGEILREVRYLESETTRAMSLGRATSRTVRVRIEEHKREVTYLDRVVLRADEQIVTPNACGTTGPAYCAIDDRHHAMKQGDRLELEFDVPAGARIELVATGYYVPR